jgi:hypothetical protein
MVNEKNKIIKEYFEQENAVDKIYYDEWSKREFKKYYTEYMDGNGNLITSIVNIFDKTVEDIEKEELNMEHVKDFIKDKRNENMVVLHKNEYNRLLQKIKDLDNKVYSLSKKLEKYNIHNENILENKLKKEIDPSNPDDEKNDVHNDVDVLNKLNINNIETTNINDEEISTKFNSNNIDNTNNYINDDTNSTNNNINEENNFSKNEVPVKKKNKYTLENAIRMFEESIKINNYLEINEEIDDDDDFKEILEDIYINKFDKIKVFGKLYNYLEDCDESYIKEIYKIYDIDTKDKKKKLNQKINRCHQLIESLKKIDENDRIVKIILTPTFLINLKKEYFDSLTNYIENYKLL